MTVDISLEGKEEWLEEASKNTFVSGYRINIEEYMLLPISRHNLRELR